MPFCYCSILCWGQSLALELGLLLKLRSSGLSLPCAERRGLVYLFTCHISSYKKQQPRTPLSGGIRWEESRGSLCLAGTAEQTLGSLHLSEAAEWGTLGSLHLAGGMKGGPLESLHPAGTTKGRKLQGVSTQEQGSRNLEVCLLSKSDRQGSLVS